MIYLDKRIGSGDLTRYFERWGVPHERCLLDFADVAFCGYGPTGQVDVGVEIKTVSEVFDCIHGATRFAGHQLPGLLKSYFMVWLVVEGFCGFDREGLLLTKVGDRLVPLERAGRYCMYRDFAHFVMTMEIKAQLRVKRTISRLDTARFVVDLWTWWTGKDWDEHRSHLNFDNPQLPDGEILLQKPKLKHRWAKELDGIGWRKSRAVSLRFKSAREMANAPPEAWMEIDGIGKILSKKIIAAIEEEE